MYFSFVFLVRNSSAKAEPRSNESDRGGGGEGKKTDRSLSSVQGCH